MTSASYASIHADKKIEAVTTFWKEAGPERWFAKSDAFDSDFRERFLDWHVAAARRELDHWADSAEGVLALLILLDQLPRNAFRGSAHMYATDALARRFAHDAIAAGFDRHVEQGLRVFFYLPLSHAENMADQDLAVELNQRIGQPWLSHAIEHRDIVQRFGRFPHRNALFGRDSTEEEKAFLDAGGFSG